MTDIKNFSLAELEEFLTGMGKEKYRAKQIFKWLYQNDVETFDEMTDLSKDFRHGLYECAAISTFLPEKVEVSSDGTKKFLFILDDGEAVESVLIPEGKRNTLCISSQVGCPLDCLFCLTGSGGYVRNLATAEIINQVAAVKKSLQVDEKITNIVFMGMGEPLLNFENVVRTVGIMTDEYGMRIPRRKVTISTAGLVPQLIQLGSETKVNLAVSLNATTDKIRDMVMPVNKKYPITDLLDACRKYPLPNRGRITFEYVLLKGINDSLEDAARLVSLLKGIPSKVNLIPFNEFEGTQYKRPDRKAIDAFHNYLLDKHITAITRSSKGDDISAACGQLRGELKGRKIA